MLMIRELMSCFLIFARQENECYQSELKKAQREFLAVSRDKNFLLDRLLQYEQIGTSSSDSESTDASGSELEHNAGNHKHSETQNKRYEHIS